MKPVVRETTQLTRYGRPATSVFDLLGTGEVDLTAAVGWTLKQSPTLLGMLLRDLGIEDAAAAVDIALEDSTADGRTDIELSGTDWKIIIEAKQGWLLPGDQQLARYAGRFAGFRQALMVTMSDSSAQWAASQLPARLGDVMVRHEPWDTVRHLLREALSAVRGAERVWLSELEAYMGKATSLRPYDEQWVYCVVLSDQKYGQMSFKKRVVDERQYSHPYGSRNGWPKRPLTFLAFRWGGRVRQVNRVESYRVVADIREVWPEVDEPGAGRPHIVYQLGPDIPVPVIRTEGTYASGRVWALLDQLLTHDTLKEAVAASRALQARFG